MERSSQAIRIQVQHFKKMYKNITRPVCRPRVLFVDPQDKTCFMLSMGRLEV
jgi:hypothetical protein